MCWVKKGEGIQHKKKKDKTPEHSLDKRFSMCGYETIVSEKSGELAEKADSWVLEF